ncbi:redoxin domain-containing protein [Brachybacterium muris]|uniref:thioredoxin-like domain-containing protein n=1 Tax=Brachybacterium muris TaxID=219301 RepID=UPI00223C3F41|nr:thioredoxin-like domain-containing protein [Brachybacterium muris]MCT2177833.1 redoxin domain-containing protein [Brachybacterium muris]MCT2261878.1 redoxin domain-containing protein [Brachybacterium muris]
MSTPADPSQPLSARAHGSPLRGRAWLNTGGVELDLEDLRGKIVLLDFWTFCCVNCLHVLDELRPLEEKWSQELVVIGVHSPKFEFEKDPEALADNIERYEVSHPVLDDPELRTWSEYGARAWPTLMVLDTHGRIAGNLSGEGHAANLDALIERLVAEGEADGSLRRGPAPTVLTERTPQTLRYPSKVTSLRDGRVVVSDAGQHRIVVFRPDGVTVDEVIGEGIRGHVDGDAEQARFAEPNGVLELPEEVAEEVGYDLLVADTANHLLRGVKLGQDRLLRARTATEVMTVAGTGQQWMQGQPLPRGEDDPRSFDLSTPWDLAWSTVLNRSVITMAGIHQMWMFDPVVQGLAVLAGTTQEGLVDGPVVGSWWAQPSGVDELPDGRLVIADSETSAVRILDPHVMRVSTLVGEGLFDYGHVDGAAATARLQHPLGVTALPDGRIAVADTYNGAIRLIDEHGAEDDSATVVTVATDLREPSDARVGPPVDGIGQLIVVESGAHRLTWVPVAKAAERVIDEGAQRSERPVTEVGPGPLTVRVLFTPPEGHKLDDSLGPSTQVSITTSPASMIRDGAGTGTELERVLELDPAMTEGVLHVNARAASCDADPTVEFPACHMHQQDWGVPIRVVEGGPDHLDLSLLA